MTYLKVWTSFRESIAPLQDAEKGRLFDAMLKYAETGEEPSEFKGNERFLWAVAKQDIDRTAQKCEALRANGSKGGINARSWEGLGEARPGRATSRQGLCPIAPGHRSAAPPLWKLTRSFPIQACKNPPAA